MKSVGAIAVVVCVAGCGVLSPAATELDGLDALDERAELGKVLGADRVGRVLAETAGAIPDRLSTFELAFGVGRACGRSDSKEIWVAEETSSRLTGSQVLTPNLLPRLVLGGCNLRPTAPGSMRTTFELFVAMVSDPARDAGDPIPTQPVEIMALDDTTGLYNFYVLEPSAVAQGPATVTRFVRRADDSVERWQKVAGRPATKETISERKCYDCHLHGGPIMNELTEPWTNWVSSHKTFSRPLTGDTRALVSEARALSGEHGRSSLANQLEQVTRAAIATWVEGFPGVPGSGLGAQVLSGAQPGGVPALLRSVLCQTEVNYASTLATVPVQIFVDRLVADYAGLAPPLAPIQGSPLTLLPVRSETDMRIERFLQKTRLLSSDAVLAARVFDDVSDVFSAPRCALHADVSARLAGATADAAVRAAIHAAVDRDESLGGSARMTPAQRRWLRALVDPSTPSDVRDASEADYLTDLAGRYAAATDQLGSDVGRRVIEQRWRARQVAARAMFPTAAHPLPVTPPDLSAMSAQ